MKRHRLAIAASASTRNESGAAGSVANQTRTAFNKNKRAQPALSKASFAPASVSLRTHTLILTGDLDGGSAHALEAEIERLCDEGVTGITLDLRQLTYIDLTGVAVIAFRCGLCQKRGYDFALIPGSRFIHRVFERAGVTDLLPFQQDDLPAPRAPALVLSHRSRGGCEE
ncbi:MAG: STAS domain-containing protein [Solirubrobacterales bacterium]